VRGRRADDLAGAAVVRVLLDLALLLDVGQAREPVLAVDVHGAGAADALAAAAAEGQRRVLLVLDLHERVEHHRAALAHVDRVGRHVRLLALDLLRQEQ